MTLFENRVFADITKVKTKMRSLGWALNPMKENVLITDRKRRTNIQGRRPCKYGGKDWGNEATNQGTPGATKNWKRQEGFPPGAFQRGMTLTTF